MGQPRPLVVVGVTIEGDNVVMVDKELDVTLEIVEEDATEDEETTAGTRIAAITLAFAYTSLVASFK